MRVGFGQSPKKIRSHGTGLHGTLARGDSSRPRVPVAECTLSLR